jgi:fructuronate reductase
LPAIRQDLARKAAPQTLVGWLVEGLRQRRAGGLGGLTAIACDNLSGNGERLARSALQFARASGQADLAHWIEGEVRFPDTMVDAITPASDDILRAEAAERLGLSDAWPIQRERFVQWVIADELGAEAETFAAAGVTLAGDVAAFERAKLRVLNGSHSTLAYVGLRLGYQSVCEAMADPELAGFIERLMRLDMAPGLTPTPGLDVEAYVAEILARFRNPAIVHKLAQIAWDGSQKLPIRLLQPISEALAAGRPVERLAVGVAAWMQFVCRQVANEALITDPLAPLLSAVARRCGGDPARDVAAFLEIEAIFGPELPRRAPFRNALEAAYRRLGGGQPRLALKP